MARPPSPPDPWSVFIRPAKVVWALACPLSLAGAFEDVIGALAALYTEPHDFQGLRHRQSTGSAAIWANTAATLEPTSRTPAGKGPRTWRHLHPEMANALRDDKGMTAIRSPTPSSASTAPSTTLRPLHDQVARPCRRPGAEHSDIVLFANYGFPEPTSASTEGQPRGRLRVRQVIHTTERPAFLARTATACPTPCRWTGRLHDHAEAISHAH